MKFQFVLPGYGDVPTGGSLSIFTLANAFVRQGHAVTLVFPRALTPRTGVVGELKNRLWPVAIRRRHRPLISWFPLDPRVELRLVPDLREPWLAEADLTIATMYNTAEPVAKMGPRQGKRLYYIQAYETWAGPKDEVHATYRLPMHKAVCAKWLGEIAASEDSAERVTYIPYGLDYENLSITIPFDQRRNRVTLLFSNDPVKGAWDGVSALEIVREHVPDLEVALYGTVPRPIALPDWMEYHQLPTRAELAGLLNLSRIFLHTSWNEGWGMPPAEAMACGCAVVATRSGGPSDYLREGESGFFAPIKRPETLAQVVGDALTSPRLPEMAAQAHADIQLFQWDKTVTSFLRLAEDLVAERAPFRTLHDAPPFGP